MRDAVAAAAGRHRCVEPGEAASADFANADSPDFPYLIV
jgi:hypothetical protein